jgi:hypothetical protein
MQATPDFSKSMLHRYHWHRIILDEVRAPPQPLGKADPDPPTVFRPTFL